MRQIITGKRIILKPLDLSHAKTFAKLAHDRSIHRFTRVPYPYNLKKAIDFIRKAEKKRKKKESFHFGIFLRGTKELIGSIEMLHINERDKHGEIGYWIGKKYRNKGYITEAARLLTDYGFKKLNLHRIEITCSTLNKASEKVIKDKLKAKFEGVLRKRMFANNEWHDQEIFSILKEEYPGVKKQWH